MFRCSGFVCCIIVSLLCFLVDSGFPLRKTEPKINKQGDWNSSHVVESKGKWINSDSSVSQQVSSESERHMAKKTTGVKVKLFCNKLEVSRGQATSWRPVDKFVGVDSVDVNASPLVIYTFRSLLSFKYHPNDVTRRVNAVRNDRKS